MNNKKYTLIVVCIILMLVLLNIKKYNNIDYFICYSCILGQILSLISIKKNNKQILDIGHYIFGFFICSIPLLTNNIDILILNILVLIMTLVTRYMLDGCMYDFNKDSNFAYFFPNKNYNFTYYNILLLNLINLLKKIDL